MPDDEKDLSLVRAGRLVAEWHEQQATEHALIMRIAELLRSQTVFLTNALDVAQREITTLQARIEEERLHAKSMEQEAKAVADTLAELNRKLDEEAKGHKRYRTRCDAAVGFLDEIGNVVARIQDWSKTDQ